MQYSVVHLSPCCWLLLLIVDDLLVSFSAGLTMSTAWFPAMYVDRLIRDVNLMQQAAQQQQQPDYRALWAAQRDSRLV